MEKFVLMIGKHNKSELTPAVDVLLRRDDEVAEFILRDNFSCCVIKTKNDVLRTIENDTTEVIIIGNLQIPESDEDILYKFSNLQEGEVFSDFMGDAILIVSNKKTKSISVVIEPWFRKLVYYSINTDFQIISSEMKGIIALDRSIAQTLDIKAVQSYIAFNAVYGYRTLFKNINVFSTGSVNLFENARWRKIARYDYLINYDYDLDTETHAKYLAELFKKKLKELTLKGYTGIFLSGGLDSRQILAAFDKSDRDKLIAVHLGDHDNSDSKYAQQVAKAANIKFSLYKSNPLDIIKRAEYQAWITEGGLFLATSILEAPIIEYKEHGFVDGNPGDLSIGGTWANKLSKHKVSDKNEYYSKGLVLGEPIGRDSIDEKMIRRLFVKSEQVLENLFTIIQEDISQFNFVEHQSLAIEYYAMHNRVRRAMGHMAFEHTKFIRPFMDDEISEACFKVPIEVRSARYYQLKVIEYMDKELADLPSTSMALVQMSDNIKTKTINNLKKIGKKVPVISNIGRKILNKKLAKTKENTYVKVNTWLRNDPEFRNYIISHLNDFKAREIIEAAVIDELLAEHLEYKYNHMKIFVKLVNLELVLKQFVDGKGFQKKRK